MTNVVFAFSTEQVERLTGLTNRQLSDWDRKGFFSPDYASDKRRSPYSRVYSFDDLVGLRALSILRRDHRIGMSHLNAVAQRLAAHSDRPWSELTLYVVNREVHFRNPDTGQIEGVTSGQLTVPIPLSNIADDMRAKAEDLRKRQPTSVGKVERHRFVAHNAPVIAGTRVPVNAIRNFAAAGFTVPAILKEYPSLRREDVEAALRDDHQSQAA